MGTAGGTAGQRGRVAFTVGVCTRPSRRMTAWRPPSFVNRPSVQALSSPRHTWPDRHTSASSLYLSSPRPTHRQCLGPSVLASLHLQLLTLSVLFFLALNIYRPSAVLKNVT